MANWFYEHKGKSLGPIDENTMRAWIRGGAIRRSQRVRKDSSGDWQTADRCFPDAFPTSKTPDLLASISKPYFECDGLCFIPVLDAIKGLCRVNLFYQNRFSGHCHAEISLHPVPDFWQRVPSKKPLLIKVECSGGEFGVVRQFYGINPRKQGKKVQFSVQGAATYPDGKGELLRIETGLAARRKDPSDSFLHVLLGVLTLGHLIIHQKSAGIGLTLPEGVAEQVPEELPCDSETLWTITQTNAHSRA